MYRCSWQYLNNFRQVIYLLRKGVVREGQSRHSSHLEEEKQLLVTNMHGPLYLATLLLLFLLFLETSLTSLPMSTV